MSLRGAAGDEACLPDRQAISTTYIGSLFEIGQGNSTKYIYAGANRVCSIEGSVAAGFSLRYYHTDHIGSSNVITDANGNQTGFTEFTPYGTTYKQTGTADPKYKFTGKELDNSTGLYYYGARYYDPEIGRFAQADTIVQAPYDPQSLNRYSYCRNNPINYTDPTGHKWSWKKFWHAAVGALVGVALVAVLGPIGMGMSLAMAGMWGGMVGGALTGGLDGGWRGALIGGVMGGTMGALGGWAVAGNHSGALAGMFVAGAGYSGATDSWDSFAGGLTGGIAGGLAGGGITGAYSEQFGNYRAGNGFVSNRDLQFGGFAQTMRARNALNVNQRDTNVEMVYRPLSKSSAGDPGSTTGPRHGAIRSDMLKHGKFEMGSAYKGGPIETTNTVGNLGTWDTHITTEKSLALGGRYIESFNVRVNGATLQENIALYEQTFAGKMPYDAFNHNSNFAVNSVIYGAGGDVPEGVRAPGFPDNP